jgi:ribonuclease BN (tRNA processing enzyme)
MGIPDLILTPWIMGRREPLAIFGPRGLKAMSNHVLKAWKLDMANRLNAEKLCATGCEVTVTEINPGLIYEDGNVTVTAFLVRHGDMANAFGFKFKTPDKAIVVSGDTAPTETIVEHSADCDVLIHEAYSQHTYDRVSGKWQAYRRKYHTSSTELAEIATRAKPKLLVLYHRASPGGAALPNPEHVLLDEIRRAYKGNVVIAHDLDVF